MFYTKKGMLNLVIGLVFFLPTLDAQELNYVHPQPVGDDFSSIAIVPTTRTFIALGEQTHTMLRSDDFGENMMVEFPFHDNDNSAFGAIFFIDSAIGFLTKNDLIYKTTNGGESWDLVKFGTYTLKKIVANKNGYAVAIDAFGFFYSSDFGETWSAHRDFKVDEFIADVTLLDDGGIYVAASKGLYIYSGDGGLSWIGRRFNGEPNLTAIHFFNEEVGFIQGFSGSFKIYTTDGGENWLFSNYDGFSSFKDLAPAQDGKLWAITSDVLFCSTDSGANWNEIYDFEDNFFDPQGDPFNFILESIAVDENRLVVSGWGGTILVSENSGSTWSLKTELVSDDAIWDIHQKDKEVMTAGQDGTIMYSDDGGKEWDSAKLPAFELQYVDRFTDGTWIAAGTDAKVFTTNDFGQTWSTNIGPGGFDDVKNGAILPNQSILLVGENGFLKKSNDKGNTWIDLNTPFLNEDSDFITSIDFLNNEYGVIGGSADQIYLTKDGGSSWTDISINSEDPNIVRFVNVIDSSFILIANDEYIYKSLDGGNSYELVSSNDLKGVHIDESGNGIGIKQSEIFKTTDFGKNWTLVTNKAERNLNFGHVYQGDAWLVGFNGLIWKESKAFDQLSTSTLKVHPIFENVTVFPNPSAGPVNLSFNKKMSGNLTFEIFDFSGQLVFSTIQGMYSNSILLSPNLMNGHYLITIKNESNQLIGRQQFMITK